MTSKKKATPAKKPAKNKSTSGRELKDDELGKVSGGRMRLDPLKKK